MESRLRRRSIRSSTSSDVRRTSRRFFGRTSSSVLRPSKSMPPEEELPRRRSFLAKPPAPGAARRVLAVLNQSQKRTTPSATRKPPSTQPPLVAGTGYEDPGRLSFSVQSHRTHHRSEPRTSWTHLPPSPLKKPIAPSRHVRPLDDLPDPVRSDSAGSSMPSSRPSSRGHPPQVLLEVEASEISDDIHSSTDPKSRSGRFSASTNPSPEREPSSQTQDLVFIDDMTARGVEFTNVGSEEGFVPPAPTDAATQFSNKMDLVQSWAAFEERIRALQLQAEEAREGKQSAERTKADLELRNKELEVLVNSFRTRTAESSAEVEELTRHLKETRKRLNRRIRELEDELAYQKSRHAEQISKYREWENQLRTDVDASRSKKIPLSRAGSVPVLPARRRRPQASTPASVTNVDVHTRPLAPEAMMAHPAQNLHFARVRSTGNVHELSRRRSTRNDALSAVQRPGTPSRIPYCVGGEDRDGSPRTLARRSLIRRALIAHIHSSRYRSAKNAWYEFLRAEAGTVTPDQFARAVRGLAVAADAHDPDLDILRQEVCGAEDCDTGVLSWAMFLRFYQATKNEQT